VETCKPARWIRNVEMPRWTTASLWLRACGWAEP
jgi:hypothetical protein